MNHFKLTVRPGGGTALFDVVDLACTRLKTATTSPTRRAVIVLSDGGDNQSFHSCEESTAAAQGAGVVIVTISTDVVLGEKGRKILENLAHETGGEAFVKVSPNDLDRVFAKVRSQTKNMQSVTYEPAEPSNHGQFRSIEIKPAEKGKMKLRTPKRGD